MTVLLQNIDFFSPKSIIIGATNHDEILDKAIWRRFPLKIHFDLPDVDSRRLLFKLYLQDVPNSVDLDFLAEITDGLSGSEIFDIVQTAKKKSVLGKADSINNLAIASSYLAVANADRLHHQLDKKTAYSLCQRLKDNGLKLTDIASMSGIPYTTLRDNIK